MRRSPGERLTLVLAIAVGMLFSIAPVLWFATIAIKSRIEITAIPPSLFPREISFEAIQAAIHRYGLMMFVKNSLIVAGSTTIVCVFVGAFAAYALARIRLRFSRALLIAILAVAMFPQISIAGPVWRILRTLGWLNTYQGLIIPYLALTLPLTVWILANFFKELPGELEEAAKVDGAGPFQTVTKVFIPLAAPGIFTAAILTFIYSWNEFFFALLIMTRRKMQTLPVGIALFPGAYTMPWGEIAAASTIATIPLIVLVVLFQRWIISGLTAGAVKG
ncbi:MAG: carbohydrate ABC transporter permease [Deltaproteobacteria bacterium]